MKGEGKGILLRETHSGAGQNTFHLKSVCLWFSLGLGWNSRIRDFGSDGGHRYTQRNIPQSYVSSITFLVDFLVSVQDGSQRFRAKESRVFGQGVHKFFNVLPMKSVFTEVGKSSLFLPLVFS